MRWTCPKCGKKLDVSNEQLIANDGVIICPQCLLQAHQPIPKTRVSTRREDNTSASSPKRQTTSISFDTTDTPPEYKPNKPTPPPHKTRMKQASTSYRYTGVSGSDTSSAPKRKPSAKMKSKKKKNNNGMSALGCMGRTIIFTLVLFAAYVFFGLLIDALQ